MSRQLISCCLALIILFCIITVQGSDKQVMQITSLKGDVINLTGPIKGDWRFSVGDFNVSVIVETVSLIERTPNGKIQLTRSDGQTIEAMAPEGQIEGEGEWGKFYFHGAK